VSRLKTLEFVEEELNKVSRIAKHPNDAMLRYLIDMAIAEARTRQEEELDTDRREHLPVDSTLRLRRLKLTVHGTN
jgi:hypothetical protein